MEPSIEDLVRALDRFQYPEVRRILDNCSENDMIHAMIAYIGREIHDPVRYQYYYAFILARRIIKSFTAGSDRSFIDNMQNYWTQVYQEIRPEPSVISNCIGLFWKTPANGEVKMIITQILEFLTCPGFMARYHPYHNLFSSIKNKQFHPEIVNEINVIVLTKMWMINEVLRLYGINSEIEFPSHVIVSGRHTDIPFRAKLHALNHADNRYSWEEFTDTLSETFSVNETRNIVHFYIELFGNMFQNIWPEIAISRRFTIASTVFMMILERWPV